MSRELRNLKKTPPHGLAAFSGNVSTREGVQDIQFWSLEPEDDISVRVYKCGQGFYLDPLEDMLKHKEAYGIVLLDRREANVAILKGKSINTIHSFSSAVPGKYKAGGQSAARFARVRENLARAFYQKVADTVNTEFNPQVTPLKGILIGGPGPSKEEFYNENFLNQEIKDKVISVVDIGYVGEQGLHELVEKSQDILANQAIVKEKKAGERFFRVLGKTKDLATYGEEKVRKALDAGAVDLMLITSSIDENKIEELAKLVENQSGDWIILDKDGRDGKTLDGLGGIGAILRYKLQL
jgi:peptide chain release factor subunit 1